MKLTFRIICIVFFMVVLFFHTYTQAAEVKGVIKTNTTWTLADSPYIVTGNILVPAGVELKIEAGVKVQFKVGPSSIIGYYIRVNGSLNAQGSVNNRIVFTSENPNNAWGCIGFTDSSRDWNAAAASGSIIKNCIIEYAGNAQGGLHDFGGAAIRLFANAAPLISDNIIRYSFGDGILNSPVGAIDPESMVGTLNIKNNLIYNTTIGVYITSAAALIENNYFVNNQQAVALEPNGFNIQINKNTLISKSPNFSGGCLGINLTAQENPSGIMITNNDFFHDNLAGNAIAIGIVHGEEAAANYTFNMTNNNFEIGTGQRAIFLSHEQFGGSVPVWVLTENYWGTSVASEIEAMIYHRNDDFNLPLIIFQPIAKERIPDSGSTVTYPIDADASANHNVIDQDTTWALSESPFLIEGNIIIKEGKTLTIEPGVVVEFEVGPNSATGYYIRVDGILDAQGTEENPITFTSKNPNHHWGCIGFTENSTGWNDTTSRGSIIKNCILEYAGNDQGGGNDFGAAAIRLFSASPLITDNIIRNSAGDGIRGSGGSFNLYNNLIYNNNIGIIIDSGNALIENNYLTGNQQAIVAAPNGYKLKITNNTLNNRSDTFYGGCLRIDLTYQNTPSEVIVSHNNFNQENNFGNAVALLTDAQDPNYSLSFSNNNFTVEAAPAAVILSGWEFDDGALTIDLANNYWGTTAESKIEALIYDKNDDVNLPEIIYAPMANQTVASSGSDLTYPIDDGGSQNSNIIREDTTWTLANSPYRITGNVIVKEGAVLTIEPGVLVEFRKGPNTHVGYYLRVDGTLNAQGTAVQPIRFTAGDRDYPWGCIAFTASSKDWDDSTASGSILNYCIVEWGGNTQGGVHDFGNALILVNAASPLITNSIIRHSAVDGIRVLGGDLTIKSNQIHNTAVGINIASAGGLIENNYMINNQQCIAFNAVGFDLDVINNTLISDGSPEFLGNGIRLNLNYSINSAEINISDNILLSRNNAGSAVAIIQSGENVDVSIDMTNNNFQLDQADWLVYLMGWSDEEDAQPINMAGNWWGTTDTDVIDKSIYDNNDDYNLPKVSYNTIVSEEILNIGSTLIYPAIANAGADQTVDEETLVTLDASGSYDPQTTASYQWRQLDGPTVSISNADSINATFVAPTGGEEGTTVTFQVAMEVISGYADYDNVVININPSPQLAIRSKGECFINSAGGDSGALLFILMAIWGAVLFYQNLRNSRLRMNRNVLSLLLLPVLLTGFAVSAQAGYFAAGGGAGGEAGEPNVTMEAGALDVDLGDYECLLGVGIPFILYNDEIPSTTSPNPSPHNDFTSLGIKRENVGFGLYGKIGMELSDWEVYLSLIGGFTRVNEVELVQSNVNPQYFYEQTSENKTNGLYGGGIGYFPSGFDYPFCIQMDWDTERGVTGMVGWVW